MLDMFTRGLLEKKYAQQDEQNAINRLQAQNTGLLQQAQANNFNVSAGLAPKIFESEAAFRGANTDAVKLQNQWFPKITQMGLATSIMNNLLTRARIGETNANAGYLGTQSEQMRRMRAGSGVYSDDMGGYLRSGFTTPFASRSNNWGGLP